MSGIDQPWICFDLVRKEECQSTPGCKWRYKGKGYCTPEYALVPIRDRETAKEAVDRAVKVIENVPKEHLTQAWFEAKYLTATLPHSPSWSNVPWEARWYLMTEGKERVYDAYLRRAEKEGMRTKIKPIEVMAGQRLRE